MVRLGKQQCSGGRHDNCLHPPVDHAMETALEPFNPSPVHEAGPSVGSGRKPTPNSAFQTMHFKFQSNLHKPLVTAHITLILSEEENLVSPLACIAPDPSLGSENSSDKDSKENWEKEKEEQEAFLKNLPPLEDTGPAAEDKTHGEAEHDIAIPDSDLRGNEDLKTGDTLRDEKKDHNPTKEK